MIDIFGWFRARRTSPSQGLEAEILMPAIPKFPPGTVHDILIGKSGTTNKVDLAAATCSCRSFAKKREQHPHRSIMTSCDHLRQALLKHHREAIDDGLAEVLSDFHFGRIAWIRAARINGDLVYIAASTGRDWTNVYARQEPGKEMGSEAPNSYHRFGYSPLEQRWSSDYAPAEALSIELLIAKIKLQNAGVLAC